MNDTRVSAWFPRAKPHVLLSSVKPTSLLLFIIIIIIII